MEISIIVPCYNEGEKIQRNLETIVDKLKSLNCDYNIVIVNDGSKDNTYDVISKINKENVYICSYDKNQGKGFAVKTGAEFLFKNNLNKKYVNFMDADLSTDLSAIEKTFLYFDEYDVVIGSRKLKDSVLPTPQGPLRKIVSLGCVVITKLIIGLSCADMQCGFKTFKSDVLRDIIKKQTINRFAFDVEYLYIAKLQGAKIKEIPVIWNNDTDSKVSVFQSSVKFFTDLIKIKGNKKLYRSK